MNLILLLLLFHPPTDTLPYRHLAWSDFKGLVQQNGRTALTTTILSLETVEDDGQLSFSVEAYFISGESFTTTTDPATLRHEQTHFDISELIRRRCMKALARYQHCNQKFEGKAMAVYNHYVKVLADLQKQFDAETNHHINMVAERTWEAKIEVELAL